MDHLIEGMLTVGSRLAPVDGSGLIVYFSSLERDVLAITLHRQLLKIGREPLEILFVRKHSNCLRAKEIVVPDGQEPHQDWQVAIEWCAAEVLVHLVKSVQHGAEIVEADGQHRREADRRIHRIAPANPVPETEHVAGIDAELRDLRGVGRYGYKMLSNRPFVVPQTFNRPKPSRVRIGHRLQRRERLRTDDEERFGWIEIACRLEEVGAIDIGNKAERDRAIAVMSQRLVRHHGPEVRTADADINHVAYRLTGVALPFAATDALGEIGHLV